MPEPDSKNIVCVGIDNWTRQCMETSVCSVEGDRGNTNDKAKIYYCSPHAPSYYSISIECGPVFWNSGKDAACLANEECNPTSPEPGEKAGLGWEFLKKRPPDPPPI